MPGKPPKHDPCLANRPSTIHAWQTAQARTVAGAMTNALRPAYECSMTGKLLGHRWLKREQLKGLKCFHRNQGVMHSVCNMHGTPGTNGDRWNGSGTSVGRPVCVEGLRVSVWKYRHLRTSVGEMVRRLAFMFGTIKSTRCSVLVNGVRMVTKRPV